MPLFFIGEERAVENEVMWLIFAIIAGLILAGVFFQQLMFFLLREEITITVTGVSEWARRQNSNMVGYQITTKSGEVFEYVPSLGEIWDRKRVTQRLTPGNRYRVVVGGIASPAWHWMRRIIKVVRRVH